MLDADDPDFALVNDEAVNMVKGLYLRPPDPDEMIRFVTERLRQRPWSKQQQIMRSVAENRRTLVRSCTGAGKTKTAADAALAWLYTGPYRCVVTTAPTARQVKELLWKEIRKSMSAAELIGLPLGGQIPPMAPELRLDDDWLAIGFSSSDEVNFQGWHSPGGTLFILDEAMGVKAPIWDAIKATLTGPWDRLLAIANPTSPEGAFYELHKEPDSPGSMLKIQVSAFDTPNVKAGRVVVPGLTSREWIEERRSEWGESSPLWKARVLGEFPESGDQVLVPIPWIEAAIERGKRRAMGVVDGNDVNSLIVKSRAEGLPKPIKGVRAIGLDVARYGNDKTVMAIAEFGEHAVAVGKLAKAQGRNTQEVAGWTRLAAAATSAEAIRVDGDGLGAGVVDALEADTVEAGPLKGLVDMRGGMRAMDAGRFFNARTEWAFSFREALRPDADIPLELPDDSALMFQATSIRYKVAADGRIQLESKDDWRERTGKSSPDELDAVVMALARGFTSGSKRSKKFKVR